jgi:CRP/FNR family transcriptional regulator
MKSQANHLRRIPLFSDLPPETLSHLANVLIRRTYGPDETIILEGVPSEAAYFLGQGHVRVLRTSPDGREQVLVQLGPGQSFNTVPPFRPQGTNHATVQAIDQVTVYAILQDDLHQLLSEHPAFALALLRDFANRLDHLTDLVEDLSLRTVRGRVARLLLEQADAGEVTRRWTQAEIAARLGTVREMIGRTLSALADAGLIRVDRQRIVLLDREGLEAEAYE